ncbi:hypothetical protein ACFRCW_38215 [Streptomyces sp. NPDC056653]|uniref:hypothetical protein n=1 Tax=Streptomyces sp. NPDC056653 TaxID=3345894 RepID=UPI0036BE7621
MASVMFALLLSRCVQGQYAEVPRATGVSSEEVIGTWRCIENTEVTMRAGGTAVVQLLDGQDFDFDS